MVLPLRHHNLGYKINRLLLTNRNKNTEMIFLQIVLTNTLHIYIFAEIALQHILRCLSENEDKKTGNRTDGILLQIPS